MAYGWFLVNEHPVESDDGVFAFGKRTCGLGTSNTSEYRALIAGLQGAIKEQVDIIHIHSDSQLVVRQITGTFKTKKPILIEHRDYALELLDQFDSYTIKWIPRRENRKADSMVNEVFERRNGNCSKKQNRQLF